MYSAPCRDLGNPGFEVLEHIEPDREALGRLNDLVVGGGTLLLSVPAKQWLFTAEDAFQGHVRRYERRELQEKLTAAGFEILVFWCYNPLPYIRRLLLHTRSDDTKKGRDLKTKTEESAFDVHPFTRKWVRRLHPIYSRLRWLLRVQDPFLNTDFGAHYLVVARKPAEIGRNGQGVDRTRYRRGTRVISP